MLKIMCLSEDDTGAELHFEPASSFDYIAVGDQVKWYCEGCRSEIMQQLEEENA